MMLKPKSNFNGVDISEIRKMNALAGDNTLNLGIGQLPDNIPESMEDQIQEALRSGKTRYTSNQGMPELRELIAEYHSKKSDKDISSDQVIITNGAEGALWNILYTFLEPFDEVLIPEISFSVYDTITKLQGAEAKTYKLKKDFSIDIESLESQISGRTKFLIVNSPNNPTGAILSENDIKELVRLAEKHDFYIISDEIYSELYLDDCKPVSPLKYSERVIVVDGISKRAAATGLRIGWTVSPLFVTKPMIVANQYISTCASSISQFAAIKSLDGSCDNFVKNIVDDLRIKRDYAYNELKSIDGIEVNKPKGAFYIFPDISAFGRSKEIAKKVLDSCDVLTIPGIAFGKRGDSHIRISYAVDFELLKEALKRVKELFSNWS